MEELAGFFENGRVSYHNQPGPSIRALIERNDKTPTVQIIAPDFSVSDIEIGGIIALTGEISTLSLAAIRDIQLINSNSFRLRAANAELHGLFSDWNRHKSNSGTIENTIEAREILNAFEDRLQAISGEIDSIEKEPVGGLNYRVNQSAIYERMIETRIEDLRCMDITGRRPYDKFTRQKFGPLFSRLKEVGALHQQTKNQLSTLRDNIQSAALLTMEETTALQVAELVKIDKTTSFQNMILFIGGMMTLFAEVVVPASDVLKPSLELINIFKLNLADDNDLRLQGYLAGLAIAVTLLLLARGIAYIKNHYTGDFKVFYKIKPSKQLINRIAQYFPTDRG